MALDTGGNSMTERAVSQMAERGSNVSEANQNGPSAEQEYYDGLSVVQAAAYEPVEFGNRAILLERISVDNENRSGKPPVLVDGETFKDIQLEILREGMKGLDDAFIGKTGGDKLPAEALREQHTERVEIETLQESLSDDLLNMRNPALLEGVIATQREFLQAADENKQTFGFKLAQGLAWTRGAYTALRGLMIGKAARKAAEFTSHHTDGWLGNGFFSKLSVGGLTIGGGMLATHLAADRAPILSGIGAGLTVQRGVYRSITASALRRPEKQPISLVPEWALNHWRHTWKGDAKRGEKTGFWRIPQRFLSPIHTASQTMEDRMINADDIYKLGIVALGDEKMNVDSEAMHQVEQYAAVLQNRIDERIAASDYIGENDPEYNTLIAAMQVMSLSTVKDSEGEQSRAIGERTTGIRVGFKDVRKTRVAALAGSVGFGVAAGFTVGALVNVWNSYKESLAISTKLQRAEDVRLHEEAAAAAAMAQAQNELINVEMDPDHITQTAEKVFGITKDSSVDTGFTEHLVRLDMAKVLGVKLDDNGALTAHDYEILKGYGVIPKDGWQLDFTHMTAAGKATVNAHILSLESFAETVQATSIPSGVADTLHGMRAAHLDHETMMMLSHNLNIKEETLRALRWNPSSSDAVHKLFEEQGRVIAALLNNKEVWIDGKLVRLSDIPGANELEKMRHVLKGWAESRKGVDLTSVVPGGTNKNVPDSKGGKPAPHPGATNAPNTPTPNPAAPTITPVEQVGAVNPGAPVAFVDRVLPTLQVDPAPTLEAPVTSTGNSGVEATAANSVPTTHGVNGSDAVTVSNDPLQKARDAVDALNGTETTSNPVQTLKPPVTVEEINPSPTNGGVHEFEPSKEVVKEVVKQEVKRRTVEGPSVDVVDVSDLKRVEIPKPSEKTD